MSNTEEKIAQVPEGFPLGPFSHPALLDRKLMEDKDNPRTRKEMIEYGIELAVVRVCGLQSMVDTYANGIHSWPRNAVFGGAQVLLMANSAKLAMTDLDMDEAENCLRWADAWLTFVHD